MKPLINTRFILSSLFMVMLVISFSSCKNNAETDRTTSTTGTNNVPKGRLMFHLHTYIDNNEVDLYDAVYTADDGRKVSIGLAQLYISDIQLVKLDGSLVNVSGKKILMQQDVETYVIGDVTVGNYKAIRFKVGLDATTNALFPAQSSDSAILNKSEMWFGNTAQPDGYVFMNVKGKIDTSENADNTQDQMQQFEFKIGTNDHYTQINMPDKNYSVIQDQITFVHVLVDFYKLFNGVQLNDPTNLSVTTISENSNATATKIANNIPLMFRYEE
jgi:hypothetical protein